MTTAELVECERRLIAAAIGRAGEGCGIVDASLVDRAIARVERPLTEEQAMIVRATVSSGHGVNVIQALAGTGKTYTAGVLREVYESAGYEVLGVAPTGRAVRELIEGARVPASTLDRLLNDLELGDELPRASVLIMDEAGMAATRPSARLLEAAEIAQAKVIAIGDPGQLASVQAGGWLGAVGRELAPSVSQRSCASATRPSAKRSRLCTTVVHSTIWTGLDGLDASTRSATQPAHAIRHSMGGNGRSRRSGPSGGHDRQGQRHAPSAEHRSPRALEGSRTARRGALPRLG